MKNIGKTILVSLLALVGLASCSESDEYAEYANWELKNTQYIDSIAVEAAENSNGEWKRFVATGLNPDVEWENQYYVYCKVKSNGTGTTHPLYNDNVWVNYSGKLINDKIFDASYSGELNPDYEAPMQLVLNDCVKGFSTAVQEMVKGDIWEIFIPSTLGYGAVDNGVVPAYSTLIFTVNLVDFSHPKAGE